MNSIPDSLLRALGWALAHSLWQGALAALALLILLPRLQTARQRYWAAYGALVAVFAAAVGTFASAFGQRASTPLAAPIFSEETPTATPFFVEPPLFEPNIGASFAQWLEANHALIVAVWLIGFVFFLLRLGNGLWLVHRLRTRGVQALGAVWQEKLLALGKHIGVTRGVGLLESARVHAPLTIGWLKPVILLPIGFVNQLSPAEVEAVLAHELAHIARRDWAFNLFQAFVESLFYYHPAVWWVSQAIRRERENACDDAALAATGNPLAFARALVQVQEMAAPAVPALALAMSGKRRRRPLLERVRRILNQSPQHQHQVMEKITATVILLALLALVGLRANSVPSIEAAFAQIAELPTAFFNGQEEEHPMLGDSLPKPKSTRKISREDEDGRVEAEYKDGKLSRLNIDGKEIPESEFEQHEALVEDLAEDATPPQPPHAPHIFWRGSEGGGVWETPTPPGTPDAPDAPSMFWFRSSESPALAPMPPIPSMPPLGGGISIVTEKDGEGNTIIKLDNNGEETEVIVKNGELWIGGRKLEQGEEFLISGLHLGQNGEHFFFDGEEGSGFNFGEGDFSWSHGEGHGEGHGDAPAPGHRLSLEQREQINREMEMARKDHARVMEEHRRNFKQDRKRAEKEWKENQKDWEKEQKAWEKEQKKWAREQEVWQEGQQKWQAEHRAMEAKNKATQALLKAELLRDGLISDPENFSLQLSATELKVNKKKQSEEMRRKYTELIEGATGQKMDGKGSFFYNYSEDK